MSIVCSYMYIVVNSQYDATKAKIRCKKVPNKLGVHAKVVGDTEESTQS